MCIKPDKLMGEILECDIKMLSSKFPVHVFPHAIQEIIIATNKCSDYPIDYISASILAASATAIGNSYSVKVKTNWIETPILYLALVGRPGINKSHPLSFAFEPLLKKDKIENEVFKKAYNDYLANKELLSKDKEKPTIKEPFEKKIVVSDITAESLSVVLQENQRGIAVYVDELASWFNNFNRYNNGSEEPFWLSAFSAKPIVINRKLMKGSISIQKPFITVTGTIQTALLQDLAEGNRSRNGFIDRILFAYPEEQLKKYWSKKILPTKITNKWEEIVSQLLELTVNYNEYNTPIPKQIEYSEEALNTLYKWQRDNTDKSNLETDDILKGIYSKLEIYISRFALIIQLQKFICNEDSCNQISKDTVERAIDLTEYFRKTAMRVQNSINRKDLYKALPTDKKDLYTLLPSNFKTQEGIKIAREYDIPKDTFKKFLSTYKEKLFDNYKFGYYKKLF